MSHKLVVRAIIVASSMILAACNFHADFLEKSSAEMRTEPAALEPDQMAAWHDHYRNTDVVEMKIRNLPPNVLAVLRTTKLEAEVNTVLEVKLPREASDGFYYELDEAIVYGGEKLPIKRSYFISEHCEFLSGCEFSESPRFLISVSLKQLKDRNKIRLYKNDRYIDLNVSPSELSAYMEQAAKFLDLSQVALLEAKNITAFENSAPIFLSDDMPEQVHVQCDDGLCSASSNKVAVTMDFDVRNDEAEVSFDNVIGVYFESLRGGFEGVVVSEHLTEQGKVCREITLPQENRKFGFFVYPDGMNKAKLPDDEGFVFTAKNNDVLVSEANTIKTFKETFLFSEKSRNLDQFNYIKRQGDVISWEDMLAGGDKDFDDIQYTVTFSGHC